jgi:5-methylcytosine-specific restriction endonuclease McrA
MYLADHPLCEDPLGQHRQDERLIVSTEVHHRVPVQDAPDRLCDMENLMAVCRECHYAIEKKRDL